MKHKIAVIIPAYNEEDAISEVIRSVNEIHNAQFEVVPVVVNDCSADNTPGICRTISCALLNLPVNLGIGGAVQTGFIYAYRNGFDFAIQLDGDGQHPASQIQNLYMVLQENNADVVIGSRFLEKEGFQSTWSRRIGIHFLTRVAKILTGNQVTDPTSGFRMLNKKALELTINDYPDEYPEPEALILYSKHLLKVTECPVQMNERQGGSSSIYGFYAVYYMLKVTLAMVFGYLRYRKAK